MPEDIIDAEKDVENDIKEIGTYLKYLEKDIKRLKLLREKYESE